MAGIPQINQTTGGTNYIGNAQQVGVQRQAPGVEKRKDEDQNSQQAMADRADISEQGTRTQRSQDNAIMTGQLPEQSKDKDTKKAEASGTGDAGSPQLTDDNRGVSPQEGKIAQGEQSPAPLFLTNMPEGGINPELLNRTAAAGAPLGPNIPGGPNNLPPGVPGGPGGPSVPGGSVGPVGPGGPGVPGGPSNQPPGPVGPPSGSTGNGTQLAAMNMQMMAQNEQMQAEQVYWQMAMERQKASWKIFAMLQDLQTSIMQTISECAAKRAATMDKIAQKWAQVLGG